MPAACGAGCKPTQLNKRCRPHLKTTNKSYRVDETYIKVKGQDRYLYRAVDSIGRPSISCSQPNVMLLRQSDSCENCFALLVTRYRGSSLSIRIQPVPPRSVRGNARHNAAQSAAATMQVPQQHRRAGPSIDVKKRTWLAKGYGSFRSAWRTLEGIETVNMIWKGRVKWVAKDDVGAQARCVERLFGIAA